MKIFLALVVGVLLGAAALWFYNSNRDRPSVQAAEAQIGNAAKSAQAALEDKLRSLNLRTNDFKEELARTGQIVRRKARETGQAIADATADARITATIKGKIIANRDLPTLSISVNTTQGIVTLSGAVASSEDISKVMLLAYETDGVREVISTLQIKGKPGPVAVPGTNLIRGNSTS